MMKKNHDMSIDELNQKFYEYLEEIMYSSVNIDDPYDRVTVMQWIRKLRSLDAKLLTDVMIRNEYANYLRITLDNAKIFLSAPFKEAPPEGNLRPLCEILANFVAAKCPPIPMTGPIEPIMSQMSNDGKVFTKVKQSPDGGILCYIAVTPDGFGENPTK
ncbi:uncharacterized protein LOC129948451 [Eupeodes corollae]|uniref:uncharacterized protein LOC129948451 n=1 Tax=Eupeodes corollae TaxID=290404 RepID=UPI00249060AA|nr:uncharacterized protein LOC129948451 [Eupeodes corollae]